MPAGECVKHPGTKLVVATGKKGLNFVRCPKCFAAKTAKDGAKDAADAPSSTPAKKAAAKKTALPPSSTPQKKSGLFGRFGFR
jgi:hypothetical protein